MNTDVKQVLLISGPPFTSGEYHVGHGVNIVQKDFWMRYNSIFGGKTVEATNLQYRWIFDSQGLPIENKMATSASSKKEDPESLIKKCVDYSSNVLEEMSSTMNKMGLYMECRNPLSTNDLEYKVPLMNHFIKLYQQGYVKKSIKHLNYCFNCETSVANAQIESVRKAYSVYVLEASIKEGPYKDYKLLYSTTFPETCVNSMAIAVSSKADYWAYVDESKAEELSCKKLRIITADPLIQSKLPNLKRICKVNVNDLVNQDYEIKSKEEEVLGCSKIVLADDLVITLKNDRNESSVDEHSDCYRLEEASLKMTVPLLADYACVNLNPYFSTLDYQTVKEASEKGVPIVEFDYLSKGLGTKDLLLLEEVQSKTKKIIEKRKYYQDNLDKLRIWFEKKYNSAYGCCWRCKARVDTVLTSQYQLQLPVQDRQKMVSLLDNVGFNNEGLRVKTVNFFKEDFVWPISRSRVYGTPLPLAKCKTCFKVKPVSFEVSDFESKYECYFSALDGIAKRKNPELLTCVCGSTMSFERYSLDVWIDSGAIPIILKHKADLLIEGLDQTRGWFYATSVLNYLENKELPFKALLYLGWIARGSQKISKSSNTCDDFYLKNIVADPGLLLLFRSFAIAKGSHNTVNYSMQILEQEKKYVNIYRNILKLLKNPAFTQDSLTEQAELLKQNLEKEVTLKKGVTKVGSILEDLGKMLETIHGNVGQYKFNLYWLNLRKYMLNVYSRDVVNSLNQKGASVLENTLISFIGKTLEKHIKPIFGDLL